MSKYSKRLNDYLKALDNHNIPQDKVLETSKLPIYMLTKVAYSRCESDDLIQEGNVGLVQATKGGYDSTRSKFNTYAGKAILRRMFAYAKANQASSDEDEANATVAEEAVEFTETLSAATKHRLNKALTLLSPREYSTIQHIFFSGLNMSETALELGISRQAVAQYKENALLKLRKEFI